MDTRTAHGKRRAGIMRLVTFLLGISLTAGQQLPDGVLVNEERELLKAKQTGLSQVVSGVWGTTRWRREDLAPLLPKDIDECAREIRASMKCMCDLRDASVDVPAVVDGEIFTFPRCVTVKRCSGPCWGKHMKCMPMPTSTTNISVPVVRRDCRKMSVPVEEHKGCKCTCMLSQESCKDGQVFNRKACQCECGKRRPCPEGTFFNIKSCKCECFENIECSTGFYFNSETCECESENTV